MKRRDGTAHSSSKGLTQQGLATLLSCSRSALSGYLRGGAIPREREGLVRRLESITYKDGYVTTVSRFQATPRWERQLKQRAFTAQLGGDPMIPQRSISPDAPIVPQPPVPEDGPVERLHHELGQYARSCRIREYVAAIRQAHPNGIEPKSELEKWVTWLERHADNVNPITALADTPAPVVIPVASAESESPVIDLDELPSFAEFEKMLNEELAGVE